jgi:hypothetical protein
MMNSIMLVMRHLLILLFYGRLATAISGDVSSVLNTVILALAALFHRRLFSRVSRMHAYPLSSHVMTTGSLLSPECFMLYQLFRRFIEWRLKALSLAPRARALLPHFMPPARFARDGSLPGGQPDAEFAADAALGRFSATPPCKASSHRRET